MDEVPSFLKPNPAVDPALSPQDSVAPNVQAVGAPQVSEAPDAPESQQDLLDKASGKVVKTPTSHIAPMVLSGQYELPIEGYQYVIDKSGSMLQIPNSQYAQALKTGEFVPANDAEIRKEMYQQKYGDSELKAAGAAALRGLSIGLSDQALVKSGLVESRTLEGLKEANPVLSTAAEIGGAIGGLFIPAGPVAAASKAGAMAERAVIKGIEKAGIGSTVAKSIASKIAPAIAGSAVEASAYGVGQLVTEDALGTADFNAENLAAYAGTAALFGAGFGAVIGAAKAALPAVVSKVKDSKILGNILDPEKNAQDIAGFTDLKWAKEIKRNKNFADDVLEAYRNPEKIGLNVTDDAETVLSKVQNFKQKTGEKIGAILEDIKTAGDDVLPQAKEVFGKLANKIDDLKKEAQIIDGITAPEREAFVKLAEKYKDTYKYSAFSSGDEKLGIDTLQKLRQSLDDAARFDIQRNTDPANIQIAKNLRFVLREEIDALADRVGKKTGSNLGAELKAANKDYTVVSKLVEPAERRVAKGSSLSLKDYMGATVAGGIDFGLGAGYLALRKAVKTDVAKNLAVLGALEKANLAVNKAVDSSVFRFFSKSAKATELTAVKSITDSVLSRTESGKKPASRKEAYINLQNNLYAMSSNMEKLQERLNKSTGQLYGSAPNTSAALDGLGTAAVSFLNQKLPRKVSDAGGMFKRAYQPSMLELSKFERYLQTVEEPQKAIKNFSNGRLSREEAEALQTVYPNLFSRLQEKTLEYVGNNPNLPYQKKLQLGILMNLNTDASLSGESILALQGTFASSSPAEEGGAVKTTSKGLGEIKKASRMDFKQDEA